MELTVGPGQEYETIQDAVDAAKQGSKILVFPLVYPDLYEENVLITKNNLQIIMLLRPTSLTGL
jgi:pectin methylesterase-like acyl-CoA thioesterase